MKGVKKAAAAQSATAPDESADVDLFSQLAMITFRRCESGGWSFTCYGRKFELVCTNRDLPDVFAGLEQILGWLASSADASGGMGSEPAGKPEKIEPVRGELKDPPMVLAVSSQRRPRKRR